MFFFYCRLVLTVSGLKNLTKNSVIGADNHHSCVLAIYLLFPFMFLARTIVYSTLGPLLLKSLETVHRADHTPPSQCSAVHTSINHVLCQIICMHSFHATKLRTSERFYQLYVQSPSSLGLF